MEKNIRNALHATGDIRFTLFEILVPCAQRKIKNTNHNHIGPRRVKIKKKIVSKLNFEGH